MNVIHWLARLLIFFLALHALPAIAQDVEEASIGEAVERHLSDDTPFTQWVQDPERLATEEGDTLETREKITDSLSRYWRAETCHALQTGMAGQTAKLRWTVNWKSSARDESLLAQRARAFG